MHAFSEGDCQHVQADDTHLGLRQTGFTQAIYRLATVSHGHVTLCHHVLQRLPDVPNHLKRAHPEYVVEVFAEHPGRWMTNPDLTTEGFFKKSYDSHDKFPGMNKPLRQNVRPGTHLHTRVGFPIREKEHDVVSGIAWFCFADLHHLDWSERLFISALSNYLAQASKAHGLRLAIRSFRHMLRNVCDNSIMEMQQSLHPEVYGNCEHEVDGLSPTPSLKEAVATGSDVLFSVKMKAAEVKVLLDPSDPETAYLPWQLMDIFRRAWSVASNLSIRSDDFRLRNRDGRKIDRGGELTVIYDGDIDPRTMKVNSALYTVSLNILSNSFPYVSPYVVWVRLLGPILRVWFANGGAHPGADLYAIPEAIQPQTSRDRGVGIPLVKEVLHHEKGQVRMICRQEFVAENPDAPTEFRKCETFVEVLLPT